MSNFGYVPLSRLRKPQAKKGGGTRGEAKFSLFPKIPIKKCRTPPAPVSLYIQFSSSERAAETEAGAQAPLESFQIWSEFSDRIQTSLDRVVLEPKWHKDAGSL